MGRSKRRSSKNKGFTRKQAKRALRGREDALVSDDLKLPNQDFDDGGDDYYGRMLDSVRRK